MLKQDSQQLDQARKDFPLLKKSSAVYLDSAATTHKPQCVLDAMNVFYQDNYGTVHRAIYDLASVATEAYQQARSKVRAFLNAASDHEIIFTKGTTESINLVASSFCKAFVHAGDEVIISELEHHSNIVPWQVMCQERGATLKVIPITDDGDLDLDAYEQLLSSKTKIVAVAHISNAIGTVHPIKEIIARAHQYDATVLIDGAQAAPHMPVDVQDLDADFYVFSGHKIYGPTGIGVLYGKEKLLEAMPPYQTGGGMIDTVTFKATTYHKLPYKFEAGTPMIAEAVGLAAAIDYLNHVKLEEIYGWEQRILEKTLLGLQSIDSVRIIGDPAQRGSLVSFTVDGIHPLDIGTWLNLKNIAVRTGHHCAQLAMRRFNVPATVRVSFGLYNTEEEIERFIASLGNIVDRWT